MSDPRYAICMVFHAHLPFVREFNTSDDLDHTAEESWFFDALSETYIPLLQAFDRLESSRIPFRLGLSISPLLCHLLSDELLLNKYLAYTGRQIEFGRQEIERTANSGDLHNLAKMYLDRIIDQRITFTERYECNILKVIDVYRSKGKIEILAGPATHAFLPFYSPPEAIQAQIETALPCYRRYFGGCPGGFWLPELGWNTALESYLRAYNFSYTIVNTHGLIYGNPPPLKGSFYPVKTPGGIFVYGRDFYASKEMENAAADETFRDNNRDAGYELSPEEIGQFLNKEGERHSTGYKYWQRKNAQENAVYCPQAAAKKTANYAKTFLENRLKRLSEAAKHMNETPVSLCAYNADDFGRYWYEGTQFIEELFRQAVSYPKLKFVMPGEYLYKQDMSTFQVSTPEFSSWGFNGYGETWLDSSNDWMYRHIARSTERMIELAERFPNETGIKERTLNQAAREILLAQCSDWAKQLYRQDSACYARNKVENSLRNFTTIYEALGSSYISTEWLTSLERRHNVFPDINYRVFRRKK